MTGKDEFPPTPGGGSTDGGASSASGAPGGSAAGAGKDASAPKPASAVKPGKGEKAPKGGDQKAARSAGSRAGRNAAVAVGVAALLVVVGAAAEPYAPGATEIKMAMSSDSELINADTLKDLKFEVTGGKKDMVLKLDGQEVEGVREGDTTIYEIAEDLAEGKHTFSATSKGRLPGRKVTAERSFEIDKTAPVLTLDAPTAKDLRSEVTLSGRAEGADEVKIGDEVVEVKDGAFSKTFPTAVAGVTVVARDAAGNVTEQVADVVVKHPGMRAVHMTALAWASDTLREPVIQMIKDKKIDTVQLDIKDEDGAVGYLSEVELAKVSGAAKDIYDIDEAVKQIHDLGARVTGRIVAFRDPKLAKWAIGNGKMDYLVQDNRGKPFDAGTYGVASFTSLASPDVVKYNVDLGVEAAKHGFDDIMYDYIRRPETRTGSLDGQVFPGLGDRTPEQAIADFCAQAQKGIREAGAFVGAAVYGISSFTPFSVAQNIPMMAKHLDFISPMVYPSHWGPGEFSVAKPNSQPYDIINRSLKDFNRQVLGTNAIIIPWLQDFNWAGVSYDASMIRAQIKAAGDAGINSWLLWNANARYTADGLEAKDKSSDAPGELIYSINKPGNNSEGTKDAAEAKAYIDTYYKYKAAKKVSEFVWPLPEGTVVPGDTAPVESSADAGSDTQTDTQTDTGTDADTDSSGDAATPAPSADSTPSAEPTP